jgi:sigma-B regulation protein RsbU (phosphoserine phosphatase)
MARKKGLSLRYKILFMLTLIPLIMLGVYLFVAINVFKTDKIAYVYQSSTAVAETLSAQAATNFVAMLNSAKPIMQEFALRRNFAQISQGVISSDTPLQWVAVYSNQDAEAKDFKRLAIIERDGINSDTDLNQIPDLQALLTEAVNKTSVIRTPYKDDRVVLIEKVPDPVSPNGLVFVMMTKMPELAGAFQSPGAFENFLVTETGQVLFGPLSSADKPLSDRIGDDFLKRINEQKFSSGASGIKAKSGEDLLAGFAKSGFGNVDAISLVSQAEALKAVKVLVIRSFLFVMFLISVTVIVSLFASGSLTSALTDLFQATNSIAEGKFDVRVQIKSRDEVGSLADSFNAMAGEVARLMGETAEKARMESELKTARTVQETLFPPSEAKIGPIQISGFYEPASECGGDWWHYCEIGNKVFFWIGDATGHGAAAALITSAAKSAATIIEKLNVEPGAALGLMNSSIYEVSHGNVMMTFFLGCFDRVTKKFTYCNASHEAPFLIKKKDGALKKKDLIPLNDVNSPRLGQAKDTVYEQCEIDFNEGDRILFYTDGIPDIQNPKSEPWGEREFIKGILLSNAGFPDANIAVQNLIRLFTDYRQEAALKDDVTFFMCEYTSLEDSRG